MQNRIYILLFSLIALCNFPFFAQTSNIDGSWEGKLMINPEMGLRLVIHIQGSEGGDQLITMDSPDQGAYGIPMQVEFISSDSLNVAVPQIALKYKGKLQGDSIKGDFSQGPLTLPLTLRPQTTSLNRPQTPQPPFPYLTEEVSFCSSLDGAPLYGTLSLPEAALTKDNPVVVMVSGSGTQNRDEEIFGHKPFAVIADHLARNGIATLRYDDRGFDPSTGLPLNLTTYENSMDAIGAIQFLKERGFSKIGILGHSEGALIVDKVANIGDLIDFIVELGGPIVSGDKILLFQNEYLLRDGGLPEEYIAMYIDAMKGLFESHKETAPVPFDETKYEIFSEKSLSDPVLSPLAKNLKENLYEPAPWIKYFINYDPIDDIKGITKPVLFLYGEKDTQVPPSLNVPVLTENIPGTNVKVYKDLNHLMQHCITGKITEYTEIKETISPEVLDDIVSFINSIL